MVISAKLIAILAVLIIGATGTVLYLSTYNSLETGVGSGESPGAGNTTTTTMEEDDISNGGTAGLENIWEKVDEPSMMRMVSENIETPLKAPVFMDGKYHNITSIKMRYTIRIGNSTSGFNFTWRIRTEAFTAECYNYMEQRWVSITVENATIIDIGYYFDDGYWFNASVYLKDTALIWAFNYPPLIDLETHATPHGAQAIVLGAIFHSSDPGSNGWWSSAIPLLSLDEGAECTPRVEGSPEAYSLLDHLSPWMNLNIPYLLEPEEAFNALYGLKLDDHWTETIESMGTIYNTVYMDYEYLGLAEYPGSGRQMHIYNISITTDNNYVEAAMTVAAESLTPIYYHAYYPQGVMMQGTPVEIQILLEYAIISP